MALEHGICSSAPCYSWQAPAMTELPPCPFGQAAAEVDARLTEIDRTLEFVLQLTPTNLQEAKLGFQASDCTRPPQFRYRPCPPATLDALESVSQIAVDEVEEPALQEMFQRKVANLECKRRMLTLRQTPAFLGSSLELYRGPSPELSALARGILTEVFGGTGLGAGAEAPAPLSAAQFAELARREIADYAAQAPSFSANVSLRDDVASMLVSGGQLLINSQLTISASRARALLAHEVGTHLVTTYNGGVQPLTQLETGLASYEVLQEGMAVLSEYLVAGLDRARLGLLASRVLAVEQLLAGASFADCYAHLAATGLSGSSAFATTARTYRSGGFTKDVIYLRGVLELLASLKAGGSLQTLHAGRFALRDAPVIRSWCESGLLRGPCLTPKHLQDGNASGRLDHLLRNYDAAHPSLSALIDPPET